MGDTDKKKIPRNHIMTFFRRLGSIALRAATGLLLLFFLLISLFYFPPVQSWMTGKVERWLTDRLSAKVEVGGIHLTFAAQVAITDLYVEDPQQDTLWSSEALSLSLPVYPLFRQELIFSQVALQGVKGKYVIYNTETDSTNLDFILKAFESEERERESDTESNWKVEVEAISLRNVNLLYDDRRHASQLSIRVGHLEIESEQSDVADLNFHLRHVLLQNTALTIKTGTPPLNTSPTHPVEVDTAVEAFPLLARIDHLALENCTVQYAGPTEAENTRVALGEVKLEDFVLEGKEYHIQAEAFSLANSRLAVATTTSEQDTTVSTEPLSLNIGWNISLRTLKLENNQVLFQQSAENSRTGVSPVHRSVQAGSWGQPRLYDSISASATMLEISNINLTIANISLRQDTLQADIEEVAFKESKGLEIQQLQTGVFLSNEKIALEDLLLKTPHSEIGGNFRVQNTGLFSPSQVLEELTFSALLHPSTLGWQELQYFIPAEATWQPGIRAISLEGKAEGKLGSFSIQNLQARVGQEVFLSASGKLSGLPAIENTRAEIEVEGGYTSQTVLKKITAQALPFDSTFLPASLTFSGRVKGAKDDFTSALHLTTPVGKADAQLSYRNIPARNDTFQCTLAFTGFDLEKIYPSAPITQMKGKAEVFGGGIARQQYNIQSTLMLDSLTYGGYAYQQLALQAQYKNQEADAQFQLHDPHLRLSGEGRWAEEDSLQRAGVNLSLEEADLYALHFTTTPFSLKGNLTSDMNFGDRFLQLTADLKEIEVEKNTLYRANDVHFSTLMQNDFVKAAIGTQYFQGTFESNISPAELPALLTAHFRSYLTEEVRMDTVESGGYYHLKFSFDERSSIEKILPGVEELDITAFESSFDAAQKDFRFLMNIPHIKYEGIVADSLVFDIQSDQTSMTYVVSVPVAGKEDVYLKNLSMKGNLSAGKLFNQFGIADSLQQEWYKIAFLLEEKRGEGIALSLIPDQILLNYKRWDIGAENQLLFKKDQPAEGGISIANQQQGLGIRMLANEMQVNSTNLPLQLFTKILQGQGKEPLASGLLNGKVILEVGEEAGRAAIDMSITDCHIMGTNLGYIETTATSLPGEKLEWEFLLKNENNTATLQGKYSYTEVLLPLTLRFDLDFKDLSVFESFANGEITGLKGEIVSEISAVGNLDKINADGGITFKEAAFDVKQLASRFSLEDETIAINETGVSFNNFSIQDATKNKFTIDGQVITQNYQQFDIDLSIAGEKFTVINSTANESPEFFGELVMSANARLQGQLPDVRISANLSIDEGTHLTYVMPASQINMVSDEGIVEFIDPNNTLPADSLAFGQTIASPLLTELSGIDLTGNLSISKNASFRVDIDPNSGDYATVNGEGKLNIGITKGQNLNITGNYEITQGVYKVSFYNMARKTFQIENGSLLTWTGDPYNPVFDIGAANEIKTASTGLVANEIAGLTDEAKRTYQKPLPYKVKIFIKGDPVGTDLGFSIDLPDEDKLSYPVVASKLQRLNEKGNESMLTQQVFGLLTIGSFIPERIGDVGADYSVAFASTAAVNSLNGILTNELNKLSSQYLKGIQVDFGLQSSQDISSGSPGMTTMMDIKVSKTLLNERMVLEAQSSFDVSGKSNYSSTQNDIAIVYDLTDKGDYKLKAFNISSYDVVYKDIRTSGISLIFVKEYDPVKKKKHKTIDNKDNITEEDNP